MARSAFGVILAGALAVSGFACSNAPSPLSVTGTDQRISIETKDDPPSQLLVINNDMDGKRVVSHAIAGQKVTVRFGGAGTSSRIDEIAITYDARSAQVTCLVEATQVVRTLGGLQPGQVIDLTELIGVKK